MTLPEAPDNERLTALDEAIRTALQVRPPPRLLFGNSSESEGIVSMCIYIYIYIHIDRERERERDKHIYIYIYMYIHTEREPVCDGAEPAVAGAGLRRVIVTVGWY